MLDLAFEQKQPSKVSKPAAPIVARPQEDIGEESVTLPLAVRMSMFEKMEVSPKDLRSDRKVPTQSLEKSSPTRDIEYQQQEDAPAFDEQQDFSDQQQFEEQQAAQDEVTQEEAQPEIEQQPETQPEPAAPQPAAEEEEEEEAPARFVSPLTNTAPSLKLCTSMFPMLMAYQS